MTTLQLQLNKKISALTIEMPFEYVLLRYLFFACGILIFLYLYLVSASVMNVIAQREADARSATLQSDIGVLESKFFALTKDVSLAHASELGLQPLNESSFVYRLDTVGVAETGHNAI